MTEFLLGAAIITLIYQGVKLNKVAKQVKLLQVNITDIYQVINQNEEMVNRRVDQEIDRVDNITNNIYSVIDSRLDKAETKYTTWVDYQVDILRKELKKEKQVLKG